jgi:dihydrofolate reductase
MRLVITQNTTLDGRIEMLGDWFDPQDQDPELAALMAELTEREEVLLLGRQTFEDFRSFWPHQTDDTTGVRDSLDRVEKHVVTSTMTDPAWENSVIVDGDPIEHARGLRERDGEDVVVTGSITLCHALLGAGLVDEVRLLVYPVWQGSGRGLFPEDGSQHPMHRVDHRGFAGGVTYAAYEPA